MFEIQDLNPPQREAVAFGDGPLLILAGAGSGKTRTLACRAARLLADGVPPERLLLLTFTRRAAQQMLRRVAAMVGSAGPAKVWGGTFHATANRLLRLHGQALGLAPTFTVLDSADAADLIDLLRADLNVTVGGRRFPGKDTLAAIASRCVNTLAPVSQVVAHHFPWCADNVEPIADVLRAYTARKRDRQLLDFDDLLLWWRALLGSPGAGPRVAGAFDHVLVDEYQDTNALQAEILSALRSDCRNVTVVGDDAQAIYGFRAATVDNILRFPDAFPGAHVVRLEQNYRSTQPILDTANAVVAAASQAWDKQLWTTRTGGARPVLHTSTDEAEQSERVCAAVLERREQGIALHDQAVLFRTGHHSDHLEVELSRRGIPFVKFGGLRFLEAAHVKDLLALLRLLDNPADEVAWFRTLQLLAGVGPATARRLHAGLEVGTPAGALRRLLDAPPAVPEAAREELDGLRAALTDCAAAAVQDNVVAQVARLRAFYAPVCTRRHDDAAVRLRDLEQLELVAAGYADRSRFVAELALDPPNATADLAGPPLRDEDYLILSTIHSAKGLEWDTVHLLHVVDGMIPSDMACGTREEVEEERRLLYVATTRARRELHLHAPLRYYHQRWRPRDAHGYAQLSRFLDAAVVATVDRRGPAVPVQAEPSPAATPVTIGALLDDLWR